jgi:WD40 repeat protein
MLAPSGGRAADALLLVAGDATVLKHPHINKSVGNPVHCLTFLKGGAWLATGATSGVLVWDTSSGELRQTLEVDERSVDALSLDSRGTRLVAGGASGIIKVWDAHTFQPLATLGPTPGAVRGVAISPDGKLLAGASPNGQLGKTDPEFGILLWDLATGEQVRKLAHPPPEFGTTALAFMADGQRLLTAQDRTFRLIDVRTGEMLKTVELPALPRSLGSMALSSRVLGSDGRRLATGVFEPRLRLWDAQTFKEVLAWDAHDQQAPPRRGVSTVSYSPDGQYLLSGGMDGMVGVWDGASGRRLLELDASGEATRGWVTGVAMTADNRLLAASHFGGTATVWRIATQK